MSGLPPGEVSWGDAPNFPTTVEDGKTVYVAANDSSDGDTQFFVGMWDHSDNGLIVWADEEGNAEELAIGIQLARSPGYFQEASAWRDEHEGEEPDHTIDVNGVEYVLSEYPGFIRRLQAPAKAGKER